MNEAELTQSLIAYLGEHPAAMDTVTGIAEWWLERQHIHTEMHALVKVLHQLTESGFLEEIGSGDLRQYRLKRS